MDLILQLPYRRFLHIILIAMIFSAFAFFAYRPSVAENGWQRVQPGPMHWAMFPFTGLLSAFLVAMMFHSGVPPLKGQYLIFYAFLTLVFGLAIWLPFCIRAIRRLNIQWRDNWIAFNDQEVRRVQDMHDIVEFYERWDRYIILGFADGSKVKIDPYCRGAERLCETILDQAETVKNAL
ncbi:MAG: hypothetical protein ACJ8EG_04930 [Sphingomicrobium sp.]